MSTCQVQLVSYSKLENKLISFCTPCVKTVRHTLVCSHEPSCRAVSERLRSCVQRRLGCWGAGDQRPGSAPADVVFVVTEKPHAVFRREGADLHCTLRVPLVDALCGATHR